MAGNVPKRILKQPEVDKCLLGGTRLWKFEEVQYVLSKTVPFWATLRGDFFQARVVLYTSLYSWDHA